MEEAEIEFYGMIMKNGVEVHEEISHAQRDEQSLEEDIRGVSGHKHKLDHPDHELKPHQMTLQMLIDEADRVSGKAKELEKQWNDATKDYDCPPPPAVNHVASICKTG